MTNVLENKIRKLILKTSFNAQAGHIPSAFSIVEILTTLYHRVMDDDDVFILSKGHGCLALYSVLADLGHIELDDLDDFSKHESILGGHPDRNKINKVFASTGSLGHGFPIALGVALSRKIRKKPGTVFCLIGDGECNEGTIWETAMLAENLGLTNLVCIIDNNSSQRRSLPTKNPSGKFTSFGWRTHVVNGHSIEALESVFSHCKNQQQDQPTCVVCSTVKGKGIREIERDMFAWHHGPPSEEQLKAFCEELDEKTVC